ncbi:EAL domain-containing protein [uncultured Pseudokineococcus sp.]|uniref:EAL domain-containing protein n=1 Tax=uncultured Pseudokineococcus sp. TaxID=1642928 RepID=UPI00262609ED|nr:EAL domain-containing protein [uncultured Pseudokineococcus sp.]
MDSWLVARRRGEDYVVIATAHDEDPLGNRVGLVRPWQDTFCARMVEGSAPMVAPVVDEVPAYEGMRAVTGLEVGSYLSVPVECPEGRLLGALCAAGLEPRGPDLEASLPDVRLQASLLGVVLSHELRLEREVRRAERAEAAASTDALTGAASRRAWDAALVAEEARADRYGTPTSVVVLDLDALKAVNDTGGHAAGDALLRRTAELLGERLHGGDLVARLGGDEFGVLLVETPRAEAQGRAQQMQELLSAHGIEASVGLACLEGGRDLQAAWRAADAAMYADKAVRRATAPRVLGVPRAQGAPVAAGAPLSGVEALLALVREQLGMDTAYVARVRDHRLTFRHVSARGPAMVRAGDSEPLEATYCHRVVEGELEEVVPDTGAHPVTAALAVTRALGLGAYVGVPLRRADGSLYGTLCALSRTARPELRARDAEVLRSVGPVVLGLLEDEERQEDGRQELLADLDALDAAGGPTTALQAVVHLGSGSVVAAEALSRFPEPRTSPLGWFARAQRAAAAEHLDLLCLRAALRHADRSPGRLSVNAAPRTVLTPAFTRLLGEGRLDHVAVEITEHEPVDDYAPLVAVLAPLRARGLAVAVDDAGAGFASMRHVVQLAPDVVKIDMSIVRDVHRSPGASAMAAALVGFARRTGALTVAEGVESPAELEHLVDLGVDMAQGYLLARPAPAEAWEPVTTA